MSANAEQTLSAMDLDGVKPAQYTRTLTQIFSDFPASASEWHDSDVLSHCCYKDHR